jgi:urease accessory protein
MAASGAAFAHVGEHGAGGLTAGLAHPFAGLDHLLAMVAVGAWAAQLGGRWRLLLPATFVAALAAGAGAGLIGIPLPHVESLIALSVLALGALVAMAAKARWLWPAALVALFALFHGHAHGTEMPAFSSPGLYFAGFLAASAALHATGVAAAALLKRRPALLRAGGAAVGLSGTWLLAATLA